MGDISDIDLYGLLDILSTATVKQVKKAYRKKALQCHPDKNPDNPKAAELFHQLSRALEVLTDDSARAAYDKVLNAKKAAVLRNKALDSRRKKLKEDLEAREKLSQYDKNQEVSAEAKFKAEIERLRKEGSKQLEEEIEYVRLQVQQERFCKQEATDPLMSRLKISWKFNGGTDSDIYNHDSLKKLFSKYGEISALVVSSKKKGSALLEFTSATAARMALQLEKGFLSNPLTISCLNSGEPHMTSCQHGPQSKVLTAGVSGFSTFPSASSEKTAHSKYEAFKCFPAPSELSAQNIQSTEDMDFETAVLSKMKQAQEEKRNTKDKSCKDQTEAVC